jgi:hypothetical protein
MAASRAFVVQLAEASGVVPPGSSIGPWLGLVLASTGILLVALCLRVLWARPAALTSVATPSDSRRPLAVGTILVGGYTVLPQASSADRTVRIAAVHLPSTSLSSNETLRLPAHSPTPTRSRADSTVKIRSIVHRSLRGTLET